MKHGYIKVAALSPKIKVADPKYNGDVIIRHIKEAAEQEAKDETVEAAGKETKAEISETAEEEAKAEPEKTIEKMTEAEGAKEESEAKDEAEGTETK